MRYIDGTSRRIMVKRADAGLGAIVSSVWARLKLDQMSLRRHSNYDYLIAHGRRFNLVTPATSLIVLETLAQHVRHRIAPARSRQKMLAVFQRKMERLTKANNRRQAEALARTVAAFHTRIDWLNQTFEYKNDFRYEGETEDDIAIIRRHNRQCEGRVPSDVPRFAATEAALLGPDRPTDSRCQIDLADCHERVVRSHPRLPAPTRLDRGLRHVTIGRITMGSTTDARPRVDLFGVRFEWVQESLGYHFNRENLNSSKALYTELMSTVADALKRQHRDRLTYWDGMTFLERAHLPRRLAKSDEAQLARELILTIDDATRLRRRTIEELIQLPAMKHVSSPLVVREPEEKGVEGKGESANGSSALSIGDDGRPYIAGSDFYRRIQVDMKGLKMPMTEIDWHRLLVLAVLANIRADLEVYCETGYMRVRKCERGTCGAWYLAERMAGRQRFCSTVCRVGNARETARMRR